MITVNGLNGIKATIVIDSISESGTRLVTMLVDYPRIVHAEQLKHRMFSTSAASSRAIPFTKMAEQLTGRPVRFGSANSGMQDGGEHNELINGLYTPEEWWRLSMLSAKTFSQGFHEAGFHKQCFNRLTEPFQMMRVLITATEWDNFFWLRNDVAADPTLQEVARVMQEAFDLSEPDLLKAGEWHLPFVDYYYEVFECTKEDGTDSKRIYYIGNPFENSVDSKTLTLDEAIKVSGARSAAQSFRNTDYGLEKSLQVYDRLVNGYKIHGGALEHQATPIYEPHATYESILNGSIWQHGVSHMDKDGNMWSGNFKHWVQFRKMIPNENYQG